MSIDQAAAEAHIVYRRLIARDVPHAKAVYIAKKIQSRALERQKRARR